MKSRMKYLRSRKIFANVFNEVMFGLIDFFLTLLRMGYLFIYFLYGLAIILNNFGDHVKVALLHF